MIRFSSFPSISIFVDSLDSCRNYNPPSKMRICLSLFTLIFSAICAMAQYTASQVLANTAKAIDSSPALSVNYVAKANDGTQVNGALTVAQEKFSVNSGDFGAWYDGEVLWSYQTKTNEVTLSEPTAEELMEINPFDIINHYASHYKAEVKTSTPMTYTVVLTPLAKNNSVKSATLIVNTTDWLPIEINATFANNAKLDITVSGYQRLDKAPAKTIFQFPYSTYPKASVIDLR